MLEREISVIFLTRKIYLKKITVRSCIRSFTFTIIIKEFQKPIHLVCTNVTFQEEQILSLTSAENRFRGECSYSVLFDFLLND